MAPADLVNAPSKVTQPRADVMDRTKLWGLQLLDKERTPTIKNEILLSCSPHCDATCAGGDACYPYDVCICALGRTSSWPPTSNNDPLDRPAVSVPKDSYEAESTGRCVPAVHAAVLHATKSTCEQTGHTSPYNTDAITASKYS